MTLAGSLYQKKYEKPCISEKAILWRYLQRGTAISFLKKYSPIGELGNSAQLYAESIAAQIPHTICICDQDCVIAAAGPNAKKLIGKLLDEKAEEALIDRKHILMDREKEDFFPLILDFPEVFRYVCLSTIIAESEAVGFVCILSIEDKLDDQEFKIAKIASDFLGKQLEA